MKIRFHHILLLCAATFVAVSCAKKEDEDYNVIEQNALDAWIKVNAPQAAAFGNGMYIERLRTSGTDAPTLSDGNWLQLNFNGESLQGNFFATRDSLLAKQLGSWTAYTHYDPLFTWFGDSNSSLTPGQIAALRTMRQGDSVRIYMPSRLAYGSYGSSFSGGYQGQNALGANIPAIINMTLTEVVKDPTERENKLVKDYAANKWGLETSDTLLYTRYIDPKIDSKETAIGEDSTVKIYYVGKFLDGFIFDTNVDSIAQKVFNDYEEKKELTYVPKSSKDSYIQAFYDVITHLHYGDHVETVFTSKYGYGANGSTSGKTVIQPYTPLIFEIRILPQDSKDQEED